MVGLKFRPRLMIAVLLALTAVVLGPPAYVCGQEAPAKKPVTAKTGRVLISKRRSVGYAPAA